jgi:DNA-binding MarR family transcriptional regulator
MPSVFILSGPVIWRTPSSIPVVAFPARGVGNLFSRSTMAADPLAALLGPNRADVLRILQSPTTVTQLREVLGLSLGSVSRHLSVLVDAGLASSHRVGRTVEYELTDVGRTLVAAQSSSR